MRYVKQLIILLILVFVVISGCIKPSPFSPKVEFYLDKYSISINDNTISSEFVTARIKRLDNENISTTFVLKFIQPSNVYVVDVDGNKISELSTKSLKGSEAEDVLQFKVFGKKGEAKEAKYEIRIELWWNNTKLQGMERSLEVIVK